MPTKKKRAKARPRGTVIKITPVDKIYLQMAVPQRESYDILKQLRALRQRLQLTAAEVREIGFKRVGAEGMSWARSGRPRGMRFTKWERKVIADGLHRLSKEKLLEDGHVDLWPRFVDDHPDAE